MYVLDMAHDDPDPDDALSRADDVETSGVESLLTQLADDERLYSRELVEVLFHTNAIKACADYRMLQAAILLYEEREAEYLQRIDAEIGTGEHAVPDGCTDPEQLAALLTQNNQNPLARFGPDGLTTAIAELGATLCLTPAHAKKMIETGAALRYRLPKTARFLATGRIDLPRFHDVVARTDNVDDAHLDAVDTALAAAIGAREPMSLTRFRTMIDATIECVDPDGAARRRETATSRRYLGIRPHRDEPGQSKIDGQLPASAAAILDTRLEDMIVNIHPDDPRTHAQQRADALTALAQGLPTLPCDCPECHTLRTRAENGTQNQPPTPADSAALAPRPMFHIVVNLSTLLGHDNNPAFLDGHGLIDADTARALLTEAKRNYIHPDHEASARAVHRYPIPKKLAALVKAGELCCTFPGCTNKVASADVDHAKPFNHGNPKAGGLTERANLRPLCRFHHRHKTFAVGWRDHQTPMGRAIFRSPGGYHFVGNAYNGRDLFPALDEPDRPDRRIPGRLAAAHSARIGQHRADTRAWRLANDPDTGDPPF
ncbi:hypothetical protein A5777_11695 [Gordonia sp. 852002-10350_SCH5691597]|nr:hypothetical protein A5777_11695 [Gordonia sp. 852002-10350_SCH5691597]